MAPKMVASTCKYCKKKFGMPIDPSKPKCFIEKRGPMRRDCKLCYYFIRRHPRLSTMTNDELLKWLDVAGNQDQFDREQVEYAGGRDDGKRRRTKGAIEVSTTSAKTARRVQEVEDDSDDEAGADKAFNKCQAKLQVTSSTNADAEIQLKMAKHEGSDDEELAAMLWGNSALPSASGASSSKNAGSDDDGEPGKKRRAGQNRNRAGKTQPEADNESENKFAMSLRSTGKARQQIVNETREMDKSETAVLQVQQLKHQIEDSRTIMQVTMAKVSQIQEKIQSRLSEDVTKIFVDIIKNEGNDCRASSVWQKVRDAEALMAGIAEFIEALHDNEAAPSTLSDRANKLSELDVKIPKSVQMVLCRRSADVILTDGDLGKLFAFLDPAKHEEHPSGIASILPDEPCDISVRNQAVQDFQLSCITHCLHNILLREVQNPDQKLDPDEAAKLKKLAMLDHVKTVVSFIDELQKSPVYDSCMPTKSIQREDVCRVELLASAVVSEDAMSDSEVKELETVKAALLKSRQNAYHNAMTIFPVGVFIMESLSKIIAQHWADALTAKDLQTAYDFAVSIGDISKDTVMKGSGEMALPTPAKFSDMTAKYDAFLSVASKRMLENDDNARLCSQIKDKIQNLSDALLAAAGSTYEEKFKELNALLLKVEMGTITDADVPAASGLLSLLGTFHPCAKLPYVKVLGKDRAAVLEDGIQAVAKIGQSIHAALPHISEARTGEPSDRFLGEQLVRDCFAILQDTKVKKSALILAPVFADGFDAVAKTIARCVTAWISKTAVTFSQFLSTLLEPEVSINAILKVEVVGSADEVDETTDGKGEIDWPSIYAGYVCHIPHATAMLNQTVSYHLGFICVAASLQQVSKDALLFIQKVEGCKGLKSFNAQMDEGKADSNDPKDYKFKASVLATLKVVLPKIYKATQSLEELMAKMEATDPNSVEEVKQVYGKLTTALGTAMQSCFYVCNGELQAMQGCLQGTFNEIIKNHSIPAMFQDKLDRACIHALCSDPDVKKFTQYHLKANLMFVFFFRCMKSHQSNQIL
eukprot:Skav217409  [mRNA]  locus=scaffold2674:307316:311583:+ [translate_table: standard]